MQGYDGPYQGHGYPGPAQGQPQYVVTTQPQKEVEWQNTLCGSCGAAGAGFCIVTAFFTPCALCWLSSHTDEHCCVPIWLSGLATLIGARTKLRTRHGLRGGICGDCLPMVFCGQCLMCQTKAEWDMYNPARVM